MASSLRSWLAHVRLSLSVVSASTGAVGAQLPEDLDELSGRALYDAACANCHGVGGHGVERVLLGFEEGIPDFTTATSLLGSPTRIGSPWPTKVGRCGDSAE